MEDLARNCLQQSKNSAATDSTILRLPLRLRRSGLHWHSSVGAWSNRMRTHPSHCLHQAAQLVGARAAMAICGAACALLLATGCEQSAQEKAKWAEEKRIDCLNKVCEGDKPPQPNTAESTVLKLNGEWFVGPAEYFSSGINGASFMWWEHRPLSRQMSLPSDLLAMAAEGKADEFSIVIFLRHHDGRPRGPDRYERLRQAEREGRVLSKETPRPGLEVWRVNEPKRSLPGAWYVATGFIAADPNGAVLWCEDENPAYDTCTTGFTWRPGIAADMRFRGRHGSDWPEIYHETRRILNLLKKA